MSYSSDGYPYIYPIIWGQRPPSCVIRHPALLAVRALDPNDPQAEPKLLFDNLSSIPEKRLTSSVTATVTPPVILEVITLANIKFSRRID